MTLNKHHFSEMSIFLLYRMIHVYICDNRSYMYFAMALIYYTPAQQSCWGVGVYWFHSVRPSVCPFVRPASSVRSVAPTVLVGSISYLYILSSNFKRCVACKVSCKIAKFVYLAFFLKICNFDFVSFWLGIWCESLERGGVSECRRSSCKPNIYLYVKAICR